MVEKSEVTPSLSPGEALIKCNGQDISRKKTKGKNRIMVILPAQLALKSGTEGQIGVLEKADTNAPEFVVETTEGTFRFPGQFVSTSTTFFTIVCQPKRNQSACEDVFDTALVFSKPIFTPKVKLENKDENDTYDCTKKNTSSQKMIEKETKNEDLNTSFFSQEEQEEASLKNILSNERSQSVGIEKKDNLLWNVHHGCSTLCDQTRNQSSKILDSSTTTSLKKRESRQISTGSKSVKKSKKSAVEKFNFDSEGEDDDEEEEEDGGDREEEGEEGREGSDEGEGDEGREGGGKGKRKIVGGGKDKGKGGVKAGAAAGRGGGGGGSGGRMTGSVVKDEENEGEENRRISNRVKSVKMTYTDLESEEDGRSVSSSDNEVERGGARRGGVEGEEENEGENDYLIQNDNNDDYDDYDDEYFTLQNKNNNSNKRILKNNEKITNAKTKIVKRENLNSGISSLKSFPFQKIKIVPDSHVEVQVQGGSSSSSSSSVRNILPRSNTQNENEKEMLSQLLKTVKKPIRKSVTSTSTSTSTTKKVKPEKRVSGHKRNVTVDEDEDNDISGMNDIENTNNMKNVRSRGKQEKDDDDNNNDDGDDEDEDQEVDMDDIFQDKSNNKKQKQQPKQKQKVVKKNNSSPKSKILKTTENQKINSLFNDDLDDISSEVENEEVKEVEKCSEEGIFSIFSPKLKPRKKIDEKDAKMVKSIPQKTVKRNSELSRTIEIDLVTSSPEVSQSEIVEKNYANKNENENESENKDEDEVKEKGKRKSIPKNKNIPIESKAKTIRNTIKKVTINASKENKTKKSVFDFSDSNGDIDENENNDNDNDSGIEVLSSPRKSSITNNSKSNKSNVSVSNNKNINNNMKHMNDNDKRNSRSNPTTIDIDIDEDETNDNNDSNNKSDNNRDDDNDANNQSTHARPSRVSTARTNKNNNNKSSSSSSSSRKRNYAESDDDDDSD